MTGGTGEREARSAIASIDPTPDLLAMCFPTAGFLSRVLEPPLCSDPSGPCWQIMDRSRGRLGRRRAIGDQGSMAMIPAETSGVGLLNSLRAPEQATLQLVLSDHSAGPAGEGDCCAFIT